MGPRWSGTGGYPNEADTYYGRGYAGTACRHRPIGWSAGGGLEWAFADNWTAKVEYLFVGLTGKAPCNHGYSCGYDVLGAATPPPNAVNANDNVTLNENIIRVGVNFKFGH